LTVLSERKLILFVLRCGGAPRSFRGFDLQQQSNNFNGRSPFPEEIGSPLPLEAFDPSALGIDYSPDDGEQPLSIPLSGAGALVLDETVAAAGPGQA
jgi:hypothetical protein